MSTLGHDDIATPTRRQAMKGLAGAGVVLWSIPTLQVISMTAAHADSPSVAPGKPGKPSNPGTPSQPGKPPTSTTSTTTTTNTASAPASSGGLLPNTGVSGTTVVAGIAGATAIGLGAAFVKGSRPATDEPSGAVTEWSEGRHRAH